MLAFKGHMMGQQQDDGGKPPAVITRMVKGVECSFSYLETVHSLQELDDLRFEHQCKCSNMRHTFATFKIVQMRCTSINCPFALLAWRPGPDPDQIYVYANSSKHNHVVMPAVTNNKGKWQAGEEPEEEGGDQDEIMEYEKEEDDEDIDFGKLMLWSDALPPSATFITTENGREWTFAETTASTGGTKPFINMLLEQLKPQYHCFFRNIKELAKRRIVRRVTLKCTSKSAFCKFALLAQRTDHGRFHIYTSQKHKCRHGNKVTVKSLAKVLQTEGDEEKEEDADVDEQDEMEKEQKKDDEKLEDEEEKEGEDEQETMEEEGGAEQKMMLEQEEVVLLEDDDEEIREDKDEEENGKQQPVMVTRDQSCWGKAAKNAEALTEFHGLDDEEEVEAKIEQLFKEFPIEEEQQDQPRPEQGIIAIANNEATVPVIKKRKGSSDADEEEDADDVQFVCECEMTIITIDDDE